MFNLKKFVIKVKKNIKNSKNIINLQLLRKKIFNKKSILYKKIKEIKNLKTKEKKALGNIINSAKIEIKKNFLKKEKFLKKKITKNKIKLEKIDITLPGKYAECGNLHPISKSIIEIKKFFIKNGFISVKSSEIEDNYHNFEALNIKKNHPIYNKNDTFWLNNNLLLRTHTSSIIIHIMKKYKPPIKIITAGKVYRNDYDKTHTPMFHQIEGFLIEENINFIYLKTILYNFLENFFRKKIKIRFRPSYFPFTEPSAEIDIINKKGQWVEILGCGVIYKNILNNLLINTKIYSGLAFGIGVERITMIKYEIDDIRNFFENDIRFLKQFK